MDKTEKNSKNMTIGITGVTWMASFKFVNYLISAVITYFLARLLTPKEFGEFLAISILTGFAEIFWELGIGPGLVQKYEVSKEDISTGFTLNVVFGVVTFVLINLGGNLLSSLFNIENVRMLRVFSSIFLIHGFSSTSKSLLQKKLQFRSIAFLDFYNTLFYGIIALIFAYFDYGSWALVLSRLIAALIVALLIFRTQPVQIKFLIDGESFKDLMRFGLGYTISRILNHTATRGDSFVVNKLLGATSLGLYDKAYSLLMYPVMLIGSTINNVLFPMLSKDQNNLKKLGDLFCTGTGMIALLSVPISIVSFFGAEDLIFFLLGNQWEAVILPFKIFIIGLFFRMAYKLSDSLITAMGKVYLRGVLQFIYAFLVIVGTYVGHYWGLEGAALFVTLAYVFNYFLLTFFALRLVRINLKDLFISLFPAAIYGIIVFLVTYFSKNLWVDIDNHFFRLVILSISVFSVFGLFILVSRKKIISIRLNGFIEELFLLIKNWIIKKLNFRKSIVK